MPLIPVQSLHPFTTFSRFTLFTNAVYVVYIWHLGLRGAASLRGSWYGPCSARREKFRASLSRDTSICRYVDMSICRDSRLGWFWTPDDTRWHQAEEGTAAPGAPPEGAGGAPPASGGRIPIRTWNHGEPVLYINKLKIDNIQLYFDIYLCFISMCIYIYMHTYWYININLYMFLLSLCDICFPLWILCLFISVWLWEFPWLIDDLGTPWNILDQKLAQVAWPPAQRWLELSQRCPLALEVEAEAEARREPRKVTRHDMWRDMWQLWQSESSRGHTLWFKVEDFAPLAHSTITIATVPAEA